MEKRISTSLILASYATMASSVMATEGSLNVCEWVAQAAANVNVELDRDTTGAARSAPFVKQYLVEKVVWGVDDGAAPDLAEPDAVYHAGQEDLYENYVRWSHDIGYLPYKGDWYKIRSRTDYGALRRARSTGAFPTAVMGKDGLVCAFDNEVIEVAKATIDNWRLDKNIGSLDCVSAIEAKNIVLADVPFPNEEWDQLETAIDADSRVGFFFQNNSNPWSPFLDGKHMPRTDGPVLRTDINNDGVDENLLSINYSHAGSSGCGFFYFDLLTDDLTDLGDYDLREKVLNAQEITRNEEGKLSFNCGRTSEILSIDGRQVISTRDKLYRHIYGIHDGKVIPLCRSKFTIKPKIVFNATIPE